MENKTIRLATLGGPIHVPNVGQFGPTLNVEVTGSKVTSMEYDDQFLNLTVTDSAKKPLRIAVPLTYVTHMVRST